MKNSKKTISIILVTLVLTRPPALAENTDNKEALYGFLAGHYLVIGKELNSDKTYFGQVVLAYKDRHLDVTRNVQGQVVTGEGKIEPALCSDAVNVLRVRFVQNDKNYEITYLWQSDLDNYARLTGYVYQPDKQTDTPGMEALFIDHHKW